MRRLPSPAVRSRLALVAVVVSLAACGGGEPASGPDPITLGRQVYGDHCSVCHGSAGTGGVGPALDVVGETWPTCAEHIAWVTIGSAAWQAEHGGTYGATGRPNTGLMPAHGPLLTAEEIAQVSAYERVIYGGMDRAAVLADCGLA